jgi:hypothetical protein
MVLVAGIILGGLAAVCFASIIGFVRNRAASRQTDKREQLITSVEEKLTEVDSIVSLFRMGRMKQDAFRTALAEKLEAVNHIYKPYIHQLDIFFVKHTEKVVEECNRMIGAGADLVAIETKSVTTSIPVVVPEPQAPASAPAVAEPPVPSEEKEADFSVQMPSFETEMEETLARDEEAVVELLPPEPAIPSQEVTEEEPLIAAMNEEASRDEDELPLETFLEMETGTGMIEEPIGESRPGMDTQVREAENKAMLDKIREEELTPLARSQPESVGVEETAKFPLPPPPAPRIERETAQPEIEFPKPPIPQSVPQVPPPPAAARPIPAPVAPPAFSSEEAVHPATIFDVEAETIIADRTTILGAPPAPAEPGEEKKSLGITGEDVMDTFDKFFGINR